MNNETLAKILEGIKSDLSYGYTNSSFSTKDRMFSKVLGKVDVLLEIAKKDK